MKTLVRGARRGAFLGAGIVMLAVAAATALAAQEPTPKSAAGTAPPATSPPAARAPSASGVPPGIAAPAVPAQEPGTVSVNLKVQVSTLEQWDAEVDGLTSAAWQIHDSGRGGEDLGGHDIDYYWQLYIFTPATKEALEQLRDKAQKQSVSKDTAGLQHTFDEASALFSVEHGKVLALSLFQSAQSVISFHQYQLGPWLARATDQDRQGIHDRVATTYEVLSKDFAELIALPEPMAPRPMAQRFFGRLVEPAAFFNSERARLIKAQASLPSPVTVSPRNRGDKPCPAPVPPDKTRDKPSLARDFPSSEGFYPPKAKFNDLEGSVTLRVSISATGCIEHAEVAGTSGVADLDEGALNLAMAGSYIPGAAGDKGAPGTMMFRVKFEQQDAFEAAH
ncbi:MAG: TonB family protein [Gammaproteobacteria bacterium]